MTEILFANKWYPVVDESFIDGVHMYKIEDESGHYDMIHDPEKIITYGIDNFGHKIYVGDSVIFATKTFTPNGVMLRKGIVTDISCDMHDPSMCTFDVNDIATKNDFFVSTEKTKTKNPKILVPIYKYDEKEAEK